MPTAVMAANPNVMEISMAKTFAEQIGDLEATRLSKTDQMKAVAQKSVDDNRSMDTAEAEQFDTLKVEVETLDDNIKRLRVLETMDASTAKAPDTTKATQKFTPTVAPQLRVVEKLEPGIAMARYAMALIASKGNHEKAFRIAEKHFPQTEAVVKTLKAQAEGFNIGMALQIKAAVAAGTTTDSTWAAPLAAVNTFSGDFITYLRPRTLIGQAQFRPIPFNVRINGATSGGSASWVGQGKPKPVTKFDFAATTVPFSKIAAIAVLTQELARFGDPSAESLVRDMLADTVIAKLDTDLFDPDVAAVANVSPAGLLNGVSPVVGPPKTGVDSAEVRCALLNLWAPWDSTNLGMRPAYYTTPAVARFLAFMRDPLGNVAFPGVTPQGGTLDGIPVRVSQYLANNGGSGGAPFILVDEAEIYLADDGSVTLDASEQTAIQMDDSPTNSSSASVTATSMVSMWQTNSIAFRAERFVWWGPRRSGAIQWIDGFPVAC